MYGVSLAAAITDLKTRLAAEQKELWEITIHLRQSDELAAKGRQACARSRELLERVRTQQRDEGFTPLRWRL